MHTVQRRINTQDTSRGFTIVELLIVIVVIAVLAAITIVAYNGIQDRARASAISNGFGAISKAFKLKATADGRSTWWGDDTLIANTTNPNIADLITATNLKDYLQTSPVVSGLTTSTSYWWYDNDNDTYDSSSACTLPASTAGVNIVFANVSRSIALQVDKTIDDGNINCGKVRFNSNATSGDRIFYSLSDQQNL